MDTTFVPFDHTYILYDSRNPLSLVLALWSLFPILILVFLFSWFLITREVEPCLLASGQVLNDICSGVFKKIVRYERPVNGQIFKEDTGLSWGMPSSHSQFMAFWASYVFLMYLYHNPPKTMFRCPKHVKSIEAKIVFGLGLTGSLTCLCFVVMSRLYFEYHNFNQVIVGLFLGFSLGTGWFLVVCIVREFGIIKRVLEWSIADLLLLKDSFGDRSGTSLAEERDQWLKNE